VTFFNAMARARKTAKARDLHLRKIYAEDAFSELLASRTQTTSHMKDQLLRQMRKLGPVVMRIQEDIGDPEKMIQHLQFLGFTIMMFQTYDPGKEIKYVTDSWERWLKFQLNCCRESISYAKHLADTRVKELYALCDDLIARLERKGALVVESSNKRYSFTPQIPRETNPGTGDD
jgi:hypothetical protein